MFGRRKRSGGWRLGGCTGRRRATSLTHTSSAAVNESRVRISASNDSRVFFQAADLYVEAHRRRHFRCPNKKGSSRFLFWVPLLKRGNPFHVHRVVHPTLERLSFFFLNNAFTILLRFRFFLFFSFPTLCNGTFDRFVLS